MHSCMGYETLLPCLKFPVTCFLIVLLHELPFNIKNTEVTLCRFLLLVCQNPLSKL